MKTIEKKPKTVAPLAVVTADYTDRASAADRAALDARMKHDARKFEEFKAQATGIEDHCVRAGRLGREIGMSFNEYHLPAHAESAEVYYNQHYKPVLKMEFARFKWFMAISRKLPENPRTMQDVLPALQLTLFAGELIELPERAGPQQSHEQTPYTFFFNVLGGLKVDFEKRFKDVDKWDAQTRESVRKEIEKAEQWLEDARKRL